jgi:hypothetical protein
MDRAAVLTDKVSVWVVKLVIIHPVLRIAIEAHRVRLGFLEVSGKTARFRRTAILHGKAAQPRMQSVSRFPGRRRPAPGLRLRIPAHRYGLGLNFQAAPSPGFCLVVATALCRRAAKQGRGGVLFLEGLTGPINMGDNRS